MEWTRNSPDPREPKKQYRVTVAGNLIPVPEKENPFKGQAAGPLDASPEIVNEITYDPAKPFPNEFLNELLRMRRKNRETQAL
jgi:hypothetical protein